MLPPLPPSFLLALLWPQFQCPHPPYLYHPLQLYFLGVPLPSTAAGLLLAWFVVFSCLLFATVVISLTRNFIAVEAVGASPLPSFFIRALMTVDLFSLNHRVPDKSSLLKEATPLGGLFSLMGLTTILTYSA